ncbi:MAG: RNA polymerase sigma factor [Nitrospirales bacterium]
MAATNLQNTSDQDLITLTGKGDEEAFQVLYHRYEKRIFQYLISMLGSPTLTEETMVEVMVAAWKGAGTFRGTSKASTWLFGIAHHKAIDAIRKESTQRQRSVSLDDAAETVDRSDGPEEKAQQKGLAKLTNLAMQDLSSDHREILHLAFFEELSYQDISALLEIPLNTVKTRVFYAKQQLKGQMQGLGFHETML